MKLDGNIFIYIKIQSYEKYFKNFNISRYSNGIYINILMKQNETIYTVCLA